MANKKTKKTSNKKPSGFLILFILLPILAIVIGFFGTELLLKAMDPSYEGDDLVMEPQETSEAPVQVTEKTSETQTEVTTEPQTEASGPESVYSIQLPQLTLYGMQVGSFANVENAEKMQVDLANKGIPAYVLQADTYKVISAASTNRSSVDKASKILAEEGMNFFIGQYSLAPTLSSVPSSVSQENILACSNKLLEIINKHGDFTDKLTYTQTDDDVISSYVNDLGTDIRALDDLIGSIDHENLKDFIDVVSAISAELDYYREDLEHMSSGQGVWDGILPALFSYSILN